MPQAARTIGMRYILLLTGMCIGIALPYTVTFADEETVPEFSGRPHDEHPILAPCSRFDDTYEDLEFADLPVEDWPDTYHKRVDKVVEEYIEKTDLECDAENYEELFAAGPELRDLAKNMPTWKGDDVPLSRFDTARVLLEYLRIYECALIEFEATLYFDTTIELGKEDESLGIFDIFMSTLMGEGQKRAAIVTKERATARKTLQRVLKLISAFDRLRPVEAELECMQRLSVDVRNITALTAETSACLPRTWNAKDALRDTKEPVE